jgi:hypothetical protein
MAAAIGSETDAIEPLPAIGTNSAAAIEGGTAKAAQPEQAAAHGQGH